MDFFLLGGCVKDPMSPLETDKYLTKVFNSSLLGKAVDRTVDGFFSSAWFLTYKSVVSFHFDTQRSKSWLTKDQKTLMSY